MITSSPSLCIAITAVPLAGALPARGDDKLDEILKEISEIKTSTLELKTSTLELKTSTLELKKSSLTAASYTYELALKSMNPWDNMTQSTHSKDDRSFRQKYNAEFGISDGDRRCACTGLQVSVTLAHLLPRNTAKSIYESLGLTSDDMKSSRNLLFLAQNIEKAYDRQKISFVKKSIVEDELVLKIWDQYRMS